MQSAQGFWSFIAISARKIGFSESSKVSGYDAHTVSFLLPHKCLLKLQGIADKPVRVPNSYKNYF